MSRRQPFLNIRTEGALLPSDLLARLLEGTNISGLKSEDYHLGAGEKLNEAISRSWTRLLGLWTAFRKSQISLPSTDLGTTLTREKWLLQLFQELGYGRLIGASPFEIDGKIYPLSHLWHGQHYSVSMHLVSFRAELDKRSEQRIQGATKASPHGLVQEFLNRSEHNLWAFVSNGLKLRILRDNASLTRQAYVEFDLEGIFEGEAYADFRLLWMLSHQSRVEGTTKDRPETCWLEVWSKQAQMDGRRALDHLRDGVEKALNALGTGFIAHKSNQGLRNRLKAGDLQKGDYYRQLLRLVYRLIFLFVAEDRDLLHVPGISATARSRYARYYSGQRLRRMAERSRGGLHSDLWVSLRLVFQQLGSDSGCPELGLPALGGFLFGSEALVDLENADISNEHLLMAIRHLGLVKDRSGWRLVDYRNLGSEELGSIYESLLELSPSMELEAGVFSLLVVSGSERKTTGSYYTPESMIQCLLDSALDPVLVEAATKPNPDKAILKLKVCDPACGSGHFLIAAAHRIARHLAAVRTGEETPSPEFIRSALREVIGHCLFGVDLNPMAVELCKVSLWLEALEPGKPLSFLDHHIRSGNSLLGATPELITHGLPDEAFSPIEGDDRKACSALKKRNKGERKGFGPLYSQQDAETQNYLQKAVSLLEALSDDNPEGIHAKEKALQYFESTNDYRKKKLLADTWCAAFVIRKHFRETGRDASVFGLTQGHLNDLATGHDLPLELAVEVENLHSQYEFFHWHLAFPEVFAQGGFDCVLGNPPWERVKLQEKEWFAERNPEIAKAPSAAARKQLIEILKVNQPTLHRRFLEDCRKAEGESHLLRNSGAYPLCGRGDINLFAVFAEKMRSILDPNGIMGAILPSGLATDDTTKHFFSDLVDKKSLRSFYEFENEGFFIGVGQGHMLRFALTTIVGSERPAKATDFLFQAKAIVDLLNLDLHFELSASDIGLLNPNTRTCPIFRSRYDAELAKAIYRRIPILIMESHGDQPEENPWGITFNRMFDMSNDSSLFCTRDQLCSSGWHLIGNHFERDGEKYLPLYESKMINVYNHRFGDFSDAGENERPHILPEVPASRLVNPTAFVLPYYWVPEKEVYARCSNTQKPWLIGFRNVTDARASARSVISSIIPMVGSGNSLPILDPSPNYSEIAPILYANITSFIFDFSARFKIGGLNLNYFIFKQLPMFPPSRLFDSVPWSRDNENVKDWILPRVLELTYTAWDLAGFAQSCGWSGSPFRWDEQRRFMLQCEVDAAFFHLYLPCNNHGEWLTAGGESQEDSAAIKRIFETPRDAIAYIMDSFPIVQRKDEEKYGTYQTKINILNIYDAMVAAIRNNNTYQTPLDPPPADLRCCHSASIG